MASHLDRGEIGLRYTPKFRSYSFDYRDGGSAVQTIQYCPWCGAKLPEDLGDRWFDEIEALGFEPGDPNIPSKYQTEEWWQCEGGATKK
jgi:hypothetical protein